MGKRGFEIVSAYLGKGIALPQRKTAKSAGYDLMAAEALELLPGQVTVVPTGLKAYMMPDEVLEIYIRSGLALECKLAFINSVGIIDADYYNSPSNEGHIMIPVINFGEVPVAVAKGMRIAQGIFRRYLTVDGDTPGSGAVREGGFGSTGC